MTGRRTDPTRTPTYDPDTAAADRRAAAEARRVDFV